MSLKETLMADFKSAMKNKIVVRKNTVQMVRAAILQVEKDNKVVLDDQEVLDVIAKEMKKRKDVLPEYEKSGRDDLIAVLKEEIAVLTEYLPAQLSEAEVEEIVKEAINTVHAASIKDMGKVMSYVMPKTKGRTDGKLINEIAKKYLS